MPHNARGGGPAYPLGFGNLALDKLNRRKFKPQCQLIPTPFPHKKKSKEEKSDSEDKTDSDDKQSLSDTDIPSEKKDNSYV